VPVAARYFARNLIMRQTLHFLDLAANRLNNEKA